MVANIESPHEDDRGFTLVELLVYMLLATIVMTVVSTIMINSFRVDAQVRASADAAGSAQLLAESLGRGIRNAGYIELSTPNVGQTYIRTQSRGSGPSGDWACNAWLLEGDTIRWALSSSALPASPDPAVSATWVVLAEKVTAVGATPAFTLSADGRQLAIVLSADNGDGAPVLLDTTIVSRQPSVLSSEEREQCFVAP